MIKRVLKIFFLLMFFLFFFVFKLKKISFDEGLSECAIRQSYHSVKIYESRGIIYDCKSLPLTNVKKKFFAIALPKSENFLKILNHAKKKYDIFKKVKKDEPFIVELNKKSDLSGIDVIELPVRISSETVCLHTLGYVDGAGNGVCGIEKAYNDFLKSNSGVEIKYKISANGKVMLNNKYHLINKSYLNNKGIKTCVNKNMQLDLERIVGKSIEKGAVIITQVPGCEIRACASFPKFSIKDMNKYLNDEKCPFINRILTSYNLGSIFKLFIAGVALEVGISENTSYNCKGSYALNCGKKINCYFGKPHGNINLKNAISLSCNGYFSNLSKKIDPKILLEYAKKLNFGNRISLGRDFYSESGNLPTLEQLNDEKNMAMFSFGQGQLLATPIQVAAFINTIASGGYYYDPEIILGTWDENMNFKEEVHRKPRKCFNKRTTERLKEYMLESIENGTSSKGKPDNCIACAKTSTAETGILNKKLERITQSWFAGFWPHKCPKYCITIIIEEQEGKTNPGAKIFKELVEHFQKNYVFNNIS